MKKTKEIIITAPSLVTAHDMLSKAVWRVDFVIDRMNGGLVCDAATWAELHDCKRNIQEAQEMLRQGRRTV